MAMLADLLKNYIAGQKGSHPNKDSGIELPQSFLKHGNDADNDRINMTPKTLEGMKKDGSEITGDNGIFSADQSNPFLDAIAKSRANNNTGPGVLRQFLDSMSKPSLVPGTGTVGGGVGSDHVPGTGVDAALDPTPMAKQPQNNMAPVPLPTPRPEMPDYSQPSALDPGSIEELRMSLLTQAGQMDPNNPNGLAGRMSGPNSKVDQQTQMQDAQTQSDQLGSDQRSMTADRNNY